MNIHLPQTMQARAETAVALPMPLSILAPQKNAPVCGNIQDALFFSYLMTRRGKHMQFVSLGKFCDIIMFIDDFDLSSFARRVDRHFGKHTKFFKKYEPPHLPTEPSVGRWADEMDASSKPKKIKSVVSREEHLSSLWRCESREADQALPSSSSTKDDWIINKPYWAKHGFPTFLLWSIVCPPDFYFDSMGVVIKNGILLKGSIGKKHIGPGGCLLDKVAKYTGIWVAAEWLSNIENVTNVWGATHGFSIGIDDFVTENDNEILSTLAMTDMKYEVIRDDNSKNAKDKEQSILGILNSAISVGERLAKKGMNLGDDNALNICIQSGAKGSYMNITQIAAALGQQNVSGGRIPKMLNSGRRCLAYFEEEDDAPVARGFVSSNLLDGISLPDAQFHAFGGREGLIDTACKTKETGYFQRCLVKTNEDVVIGKCGMVMAYEKIIQFTYGNDNFDGARLSKTKFPDGTTRLFFCDPVYLGKKMCTIVCDRPEELNQEDIDTLLRIVWHPLTSRGIEYIAQMLYNIKKRFSDLLREVKIPPRMFKKFFKVCEEMYNKAIIDVGDGVGIVAAGAIGEMSTQSTLNTFHSSGGEHKAVTQGVPRLKEIKNATLHPKSRTVKIFIKEEYFDDLPKDANLEDACVFFEEFNKDIKQISMNSLIETINIEIFDYDDEYAHTDPLGIHSIPILEEEEWWVTEYCNNLDLYDEEIFREKLHCGYRLKIKFDSQALYTACTSVFELCDKLEKRLSCIMPLIVVPSSRSDSTIILYFSLKKEVAKVSMVHASDAGIRSATTVPRNCGGGSTTSDAGVRSAPSGGGSDEVEDSQMGVLTERNAVYLCLRDIIVPHIKNQVLNKETGVSRFFVEEEGGEGEGSDVWNRFFLETEGGNFEQLLSLDCVDTTRCVTDDFWHVYKLFDIEAAKTCLTKEFYKALTGDGSYLDIRLIELTVNNLCRRGTIDSMRRDSVPMDTTGPLQKMGYEKPIHYIVQSLISGAVDSCSSATANIALGNNPIVGTEFVTLVNEKGELC